MEQEKPRLTARQAAFLGIGSMVGAGIFALLGEAGAVAGSAVWLSFVIGGIVAGLIGYVCGRLGARFPSSGGLITYLEEGFGTGRLVGMFAWLGYISAIVVVTAMIAVSFGSYATKLFVGEHAGSGWQHLFITLLIIGATALNAVGANIVARTQAILVVSVLTVFSLFIWVTVRDVNWHLLAPSGYPSATKIISAAALTFFAYLGFNVITFAAADMHNPKRDMPRAMFGAIGSASVLYVLISIGVFGTLTVAEVIMYGETAIAEAARPALGDAGFTIMAVAAVLSCAGATNATLYATDNLTGMLAQQGYFPPALGPAGRLGKHTGLYVTAIAVLVIANFVDLGAIASVGSAVSLALFLLIAVAGWRLRRETGSNGLYIVAAIAVAAVVLAFFVVDLARNDPWVLVATAALGAASLGLDYAIRGRAATRSSSPNRDRSTTIAS